MKIKDVTSEAIVPGQSQQQDVQVKTATNAQEVDVGGKAVGMTNDPAAAQQLAQMYKDGKISSPATPAQEEWGTPENTQTTAIKAMIADPQWQDPRWQKQLKARLEYAQGHEGEFVGADGKTPMTPASPPDFEKKNGPDWADKQLGVVGRGINAVKSAFGMEEDHKDTVAQGGGDVGGDGADEFIKAVQTHPHVKGSYQAEQRSADDKLLDQMLTIAKLR